LWPNCLPFPVNSHRAAIILLSTSLIFNNLYDFTAFLLWSQAVIIASMSFDVIYIVIVIAVILLSMTLHEAMHAFVGYWLGDDTAKLQGRLTLNPIKHIDPFLTIILPVALALVGAPIFGGAKPVPFNPNNIKWGELGAALIAVAGPLTNLLLAFIAFGTWAVLGTPVDGIGAQVLTTAVSVNLGFFVFNILPLPPLDGSRVLYALAPEFVRRGMEAVERFGIIFIFAIVLILGPQLQSLMVAIISFFIATFRGIFGV